MLGDLGQWAANFNPAGLYSGQNSFATQGGQRGGIGVYVPPTPPAAPVTPEGPNSTNWYGGTQAPGPTPPPPPSVNPGGPMQPGPAPAVPAHNPSPFDSDAGYAAALSAQQLGLSTNQTALNNLIAQRLAAYGDPSFAEQAGFGLDPQAAAFARQNYLSGNAELARIDKSHSLARQAIINRLAGHGLLFSGDTGYQEGQENQAYGNNVYDAQQRVLADILGYRTNTLNQDQQLRQQTLAALQQAWQNYIAHPELYGTSAAATVTNGGGSVSAAQPGAAPAVRMNSSGPPDERTGGHGYAAPKRQAIVKQLTNPYVTGRKARG